MTHHQARGFNASPANRPGVPMEAEPRSTGTAASAAEPTPQRVRREHLHTAGRDELTPVFGNARPPRLASGAMRRAAYRLPEHEARRWLLLLAADRVDVLEHRLPELFSRRSIDALERQVRSSPVATLAAAAGVGFLLQRTGILQATVGTVLTTSLRTRHGEGDLSAEEERLLAWLNDAHALEKALIPVLKNHADDADRHPHVRERDLEHLKQTRRHVKQVKKCIEALGARPSASKKAIGRLAGVMNSVTTEPFDDEVIRNFLADYAAENLEIASYRALIVAAEEAGHPEIAEICSDILEDEEEMAEWLEQNLPYAVRETLEELSRSG